MDIEILVDPPKDLIGDEEEDQMILERTRNMMYDFISDCVLKTYGWRFVGKWIEKSPGKSVMDMITVSDIAYAITVIENSKEVWEQQEEIKAMSPTQQEKFKNPKALPASQRKKYTKKVPKYTTRKGRVAGYLATGWTKDGKKRYMEIKKTWDTLYKDDLWIEQWLRCWDDYAERYEILSYWVKNKSGLGDQGTADKEKDEDEVCDDTLFCSSSTGARVTVVTNEGLAGNLSEEENGEDNGGNNFGEEEAHGGYESSSSEGSVRRELDYGEVGSGKRGRNGGKYGQPEKSAGV